MFCIVILKFGERFCQQINRKNRQSSLSQKVNVFCFVLANCDDFSKNFEMTTDDFRNVIV